MDRSTALRLTLGLLASLLVAWTIRLRLRLSEARESLRQALALRDEFLLIASHELKTPLTPLVLNAQLLSRSLREAPVSSVPRLQALKMAANLEHQARRLGMLVDRLLDGARISSGQLELHRERLDAAELTEDVLDRYSNLLRDAGCRLVRRIEKPLPARLDRVRFEQVLVNLLGNAAKYAPNSAVRVTLCRKEGALELRIADDGRGIASTDLGRIFERFERVARPGCGGLGLGLYISRQIVEAHGGAIRAESEPGRGAVFTVTLPDGGEPALAPPRAAPERFASFGSA
jgi:signal transduction histidine kinase